MNHHFSSMEDHLYLMEQKQQKNTASTVNKSKHTNTKRWFTIRIYVQLIDF